MIFGAGSAGAAMSGSAGQLITFRAVQGLGAALVLPATLSIITNTFPRKERAKAIGIWTAVGAARGGFNQALIFYHFGTVTNLLVESSRAATKDRGCRLRFDCRKYRISGRSCRDCPPPARRLDGGRFGCRPDAVDGRCRL